ncbi:MAG: spermidine/putrescine transport system substrate-binding protein [Frankiaceae bacterium]|nr:spermidine/putrescine transport system substrate-binding protein [Frankiaceae bacterium]
MTDDFRRSPEFRDFLAQASRRDFLRIAGLGGVAAFLASCSTKGAAIKASDTAQPSSSGPSPTGGTSGSTTPGTATTPPSNDKSDVDKLVVFSNWPLYIDVDAKNESVHPTLAAFTKSTGVKVTYTEDVNDNDQFFGKVKPQLSAGQDTKRDIFVLTDWMAARMIRLNWVQKFDPANVPNATNLRAALKSPPWDPDRSHTLPWATGLTGIATNTKATGGKIVTSMTQLLTDKSLKGKVTCLTEMRDTVGLIMLEMGKDPANFTDADYTAALDMLQTAVSSGQIRQFTGNEYAQALGKGSIAAAVAWSGDVIQLQAANKDIKFTAPESGLMIWSDNMMIPNLAQHKKNAEMLINYYYDPKVAATLAASVNYICPVEGAQEAMKSIDKTLATNPLIFPDDATLAKTHVFMGLSATQETAYSKQFTTVTGS